MGGSGGGGGFISPGSGAGDLASGLKSSLARTGEAEFNSGLAELLDAILSEHNKRNPKEIHDRLDNIKEICREDLEGYLETMFGGSVGKWTYVNGLSDVDALLIVNNTKLASALPDAVRKTLFLKLRKAYADRAKVNIGELAITISYRDGRVIQIIPAIRTAQGLKIQRQGKNEWHCINPEKFADHLSRTNASMDMKLIPMIKLAKGINASFPEGHQMAGYHVEALAIEAFKGYAGEKAIPAMLEHFFRSAGKLVRSPIKDETRQSCYVDDDLGPKDSEARKGVGYELERVAAKLKTANSSKSLAVWKALLTNG